jgi:hypothetical protein
MHVAFGSRFELMEKRYWFNTKTRLVEEGPKSLGLDRIGPFATHQEATRAEEIVKDRARAIAQEEERED